MKERLGFIPVIVIKKFPSDSGALFVFIPHNVYDITDSNGAPNQAGKLYHFNIGLYN